MIYMTFTACSCPHHHLTLVTVPFSGKATLFVPRQPEAYTIWMGPPPSLEQFRSSYKVDNVKYVDELAETVKILAPKMLYVYGGENSDSGKRVHQTQNPNPHTKFRIQAP